MYSRAKSLTVLVVIFLATCFVIHAQTDRSETNLRPIQKDGKWGFIDKTGRVVIKPQFYWVHEFSEGLAVFDTEDGKYGYIDKTGTVVIPPTLDRAEPFSEGLAPAANDFVWGYIDRSGNWVIRRQFAMAHKFRNGIAPVVLIPKDEDGSKNIFNTVAFIDKTGKIISPIFKSVLNPRTSDGLLFVRHVYPTGPNPPPRILDKRGNTIIEVEDFDLDGFSEGLTPIKLNGKWGYVDRFGRAAIKPAFDEARGFSDGRALIKVDKKWGFIDRKGKMVIPAKFDIWEYGDWWHSFSEGLALVYHDRELIYINRRGERVITVDGDRAGRFVGGLARIITFYGKSEKRGYIDRTGKFVWGPTEFRYKDTSARAEKANAKREKEENDSLTPLTDGEKRLDFRALVHDQPDHSADLTYFRSEAFSGGGGSERVVRKGHRYRKESRYWIFLGEKGKPRIKLFPDSKTYDDLDGYDDERVSYSRPFNPKTLAEDPGTTFKPLGKMKIGDYECIKVQVRREGKGLEKERIFLYLAKDMKYLAVVARVQKSRLSLIQRLENISLEVPDNLVRVPPDYKPIEKDLWTRVKDAKVKYRGKLSNEFGVFRAPTGELYVWVDIGDEGDPFVWSYLVRPKEKTAEIAYRGLLVARNGMIARYTKEDEAFSHTGYRHPSAVEESKSEGKPVTVRPNSIKFSTSFGDDDWIEIIF